MIKRVLLGLSAVSLAACGAPADPQISDGPSVIEIDGLYVIEPLGGRDVTAGGGTISVIGPSVELIAASGPDADAIELHTHEMTDGVAQMRKVDGFQISQGSPLALGSGGPHLMIFGTSEAVQAGEEVEISLVFRLEDGSETVLVETAEVQPFSSPGRGS